MALALAPPLATPRAAHPLYAFSVVRREVAEFLDPSCAGVLRPCTKSAIA